MSSLLETSTLKYRLYQSRSSSNKIILFVTGRGSWKINQLPAFVWRAIQLPFYHDLTFFVDYFHLIERKGAAKRVCRFLQGCLLYLAAYYTLLWLLDSSLSHFEHIVAFDIIYHLGLSSPNNLWIASLCLIAIRYCSLLLTGNSGSTSLLLNRIFVQGKSSDFVRPLVSSLGDNKRFKKWTKNQKSSGKSLTWAQFFQMFTVKTRNTFQVATFFLGICLSSVTKEFF